MVLFWYINITPSLYIYQYNSITRLCTCTDWVKIYTSSSTPRVGVSYPQWRNNIINFVQRWKKRFISMVLADFSHSSLSCFRSVARLSMISFSYFRIIIVRFDFRLNPVQEKWKMLRKCKYVGLPLPSFIAENILKEVDYAGKLLIICCRYFSFFLTFPL